MKKKIEKTYNEQGDWVQNQKSPPSLQKALDDYTEIKGFCKAKKTMNKTKRHHSEGEKIIVNSIPSNELISKIHKEILQLNTKKPSD